MLKKLRGEIRKNKDLRIEGYVDAESLVGNKVSVRGWKFGVVKDDDCPRRIQIEVRDENGDSVAFRRKNSVRRDANSMFLSPEYIDFESGFELEWTIENSEFYDVVFSFDACTERHKVDLTFLRFMERERGRHYKNLIDMLKKGGVRLLAEDFYCIRKAGPAEYLRCLKNRVGPREPAYAQHCRTQSPSGKELAEQRKHVFAYAPKISIVVPTYRTPLNYLRDMIESVCSQTYANWELCIADGSEGDRELEEALHRYCKSDSRIICKVNEKNYGISGNTNEALSLAKGEYIGLLDHDDVLAPDALFEVVKAINEERADVVYTDEDKIAEDITDYFGPAFKPDFNLDLLRSNNYICHFFVVKKSIADEIRGFRPAFDGSQDYDFIFRCVEKAGKISHIPKALYHWRCHPNSVAGNPESKLYAYEAGRKAIEEHLRRCGEPEAVVERMDYWGLYRVTYPVKQQEKISILIPNKDHVEDLRRCVESVLEKTTYPDYHIYIVENNSNEQGTFAYYDQLEKDERITVLHWDREFNYSAINNFAAEQCDGQYLVFLNNDTEVISENWLELMLGNCQRNEVGAVGAKLYFENDTIQHAGVVLGLGGIAGHVMVGERRGALGYCAKALIQQDYSAVTAACMMMPRYLFEEIGGFDERLSVAFNDVDLCLNIRKKDLLIVFDPNVELYHYESRSRGLEETPEKIQRFEAEGIYMKEKWGEVLEKEDPYYNCNFTLSKPDFSLRDKIA